MGGRRKRPRTQYGYFAVPREHLGEMVALNDALFRADEEIAEDDVILARLYERAMAVAAHTAVIEAPRYRDEDRMRRACETWAGALRWRINREVDNLCVFTPEEARAMLEAVRAWERVLGGPAGIADELERVRFTLLPPAILQMPHAPITATLHAAVEGDMGFVWAQFHENVQEWHTRRIAERERREEEDAKRRELERSGYESPEARQERERWEEMERNRDDHRHVGLFLVPQSALRELGKLQKAVARSMRTRQRDFSVLENALYRRMDELAIDRVVLSGWRHVYALNFWIKYLRHAGWCDDWGWRSTVLSWIVDQLDQREQEAGGPMALMDQWRYHHSLQDLIPEMEVVYQEWKRLARASGTEHALVWAVYRDNAEAELVERMKVEPWDFTTAQEFWIKHPGDLLELRAHDFLF